MAKRMGLIPLRQQIRELEGVYGRVQEEIGSQLLSVKIVNYQDVKSMKAKERIDMLIKKLNRMSIRWVRESMPLAYKESFIVAEKRLEILGARKDEGYKIQNHRNSVDDYIELAMKDLITANESIKNNVNMYLYLAKVASADLMQLQAFGPEDGEVIASIITDALEEGKSRAYASKRIHEYLRLQLLDGQFITIRGRNYNLRSYSKMVARTRLREAQTQAVKNTCAQYDNDLVQVSEHGTDCEICMPYEGEIYSLSGRHPTYPSFNIDIPLHPNCEHNISPTSEVAIGMREARV